MKIKAIHRNPSTYSSSITKSSINGFHNPDPILHPFSMEREYIRALTATKLDKMFAKPFIASLDGHTDSITCISKSKLSSRYYFTGSSNGEVFLWNIDTRSRISSIVAHEGSIKDLCYALNEDLLFTCGGDCIIKQWDVNTIKFSSNSSSINIISPKAQYNSENPLTSIHHHYDEHLFVTGGDSLDLWDYERSFPIQTTDLKGERVISTKFNNSETNLVGVTASNNRIYLYDRRTNLFLNKVHLQSRSNSICWNPIFPIYFTVANEDSNLYTFDLRKIDTCLKTHKDFTNAVLTLDYSPTGLEFVAGSYDKTVRIFDPNQGKSHEVYHTRRMQQVLSCCYTSDSSFILTGSSDFCLRIWKSNASTPLGPQTQKQIISNDYRDALKNKYKDFHEIKRIKRHKHVPALIRSTQNKHKIMSDARAQKEENVRLNTKRGTRISQRQRPIVKSGS